MEKSQIKPMSRQDVMKKLFHIINEYVKAIKEMLLSLLFYI